MWRGPERAASLRGPGGGGGGPEAGAREGPDFCGKDLYRDILSSSVASRGGLETCGRVTRNAGFRRKRPPPTMSAPTPHVRVGYDQPRRCVGTPGGWAAQDGSRGRRDQSPRANVPNPVIALPALQQAFVSSGGCMPWGSFIMFSNALQYSALRLQCRTRRATFSRTGRPNRPWSSTKVRMNCCGVPAAGDLKGEHGARRSRRFTSTCSSEGGSRFPAALGVRSLEFIEFVRVHASGSSLPETESRACPRPALPVRGPDHWSAPGALP